MCAWRGMCSLSTSTNKSTDTTSWWLWESRTWEGGKRFEACKNDYGEERGARVVITIPSQIPQTLYGCLISYSCGSLSVLSHPEYVFGADQQTAADGNYHYLMVFMVFSRSGCIFSSWMFFHFRKSKHFLRKCPLHWKFWAADYWNTLFPFACLQGMKLKRLDHENCSFLFPQFEPVGISHCTNFMWPRNWGEKFGLSADVQSHHEFESWIMSWEKTMLRSRPNLTV